MTKKTGRRWTARRARPRLTVRDLGPAEAAPGLRAFAIDHPVKPTTERQPESTHLVRCPRCGQVRYVDRRFVESIEEVKRRAEGTDITFVGARHAQCETVLEIIEL